MRPIAPRIRGLDEVTVAENQAEYRPVTVAIRRSDTHQGATEIITRWTFSEEERSRIAAGDDILVTQLSWSGRMAPMDVTLMEVPQHG
jgi:hypothetical protein